MVATHITQCFTRQELAEFAAGSVDVDQLELMAVHIDTCVSCQATISNLEDQPDSFVAHLKQLCGQHEGVEESACQAVIDQLVQRHADPRQRALELPPIPTSIGGYPGSGGFGGMGGPGTAYPAFYAGGTPAAFGILSVLEQLGQAKEAIPILRKHAEEEGPYKEYAKQMLEKLEAEANESAKTQEPPRLQRTG